MDIFDRCLEIMENHLIRSHVEFKRERGDKFQRRKVQRAQREDKYCQRHARYPGKSSVIEAFVRTIVTNTDEDYQRVTPSKYARFWEVDVSTSTEWALEI
ncbi:hypothetical protein G7Y89_g15493 [Cudoniella acicularis]|uniref:Uncharacterized protein n=1 Tax=Cudoniella acicularis TaxID=354080 RepID=A0A8H4VML4_9HELO|nr:hypothetical protein G7Y89_g15493 [Cudoniella acicularis]